MMGTDCRSSLFLKHFQILKEQGIETITIVTSAYHQLRGQTLYSAMASRYAQEQGYSVEIVGNYCCDVENAAYQNGDQIAAMQISGILQLPGGGTQGMPRP